MKICKKTRKSLNSSLSRVSNWFDAYWYLKNCVSFSEKESQLSYYSSQYEKMQQKIEALDDTELGTDEKIETEEKYFTAVAAIKTRIKIQTYPMILQCPFFFSKY